MMKMYQTKEEELLYGNKGYTEKAERREKSHTQDELAEHVRVTRQAVSRWETGETQPNTDTLRLLSKEFNVSINTLLGSPRQLVCQC